MVITTDNLVKIYNTRHVVDGVSISVEQGSVVGLLVLTVPARRQPSI